MNALFSSDPDGFWSTPEAVARFGAREPDIHLLSLLEGIGDARGLRALDLGCAAGRNAVALRDRGAAVVAIDSSLPMCAATRDRIDGRTALARMDRLPIPGGSMDLVVALGVYHQAKDDDELLLAFAETARVVAPGGLVLLSVFSREMLPADARPADGWHLTYDTPHRGRRVRLSEDQLVTLLGDVGFTPRIPVETRRKQTDREERISLLGIFERVVIRDDGRTAR